LLRSLITGYDISMTPIRTAARTLLGTLFVGSGLLALRHPGQLANRAKPVADSMSPMLQAAGLPTDPETLVKANALIQVTGGALLASGVLARPAAAALAATVVPSTVAAHPFWTEADPQRKAEQQVQFAKNLGLLGGLLLAVTDRGGRPSLAWRARYAAKTGRRAAKSAGAIAGLSGAVAAEKAGSSVRRAGQAATHARHSVARTARTGRREARLAVRAVNLGRRLPF
jgi:putative oxidoreductase